MPYKIDTCGIYKLVNLATGQCYVGQSQRVKKRIKEHFRLLRGDKHPNQHLQNAYNKYGAANFVGEVEVECEHPDQLDALEEAFLTGDAWFDEPVVYNIADFAKAPMRGKAHSEETRQKIGDRRKQYSQTSEGRIMNKLKSQLYLYELIDPDGEVYVTENLFDFAKQYQLTNSSLNKVVHGKQSSYKGWKGRIIERLR